MSSSLVLLPAMLCDDNLYAPPRFVLAGTSYGGSLAL